MNRSPIRCPIDSRQNHVDRPIEILCEDHNVPKAVEPLVYFLADDIGDNTHFKVVLEKDADIQYVLDVCKEQIAMAEHEIEISIPQWRVREYMELLAGFSYIRSFALLARASGKPLEFFEVEWTV